MGIHSGEAEGVAQVISEHEVQKSIMLAASPYAVLFRTNAGTFYQGKIVYSKEFKQNVLINIRKIDGLPIGYSDLSGVRKSDGRAVFVEVKRRGGTASDEQKHFIEVMKSYGALAGVCRSAEEAVNIINGLEGT